MDMTGEYRIQAPRQRVWEALNDPEILKQAIPGCDTIDKLSDTEMSAKVTAKVGPVKASFTGQVTLSDLNPPESYRISGEGKGGAAGFAKGGANVTLAEDGDATVLSYEVNATVGGKLAQLGARLIDGTAKKMANEFFAKFAEVVESGEGAAAPAADVPAAATAASEPAAAAAPAPAAPEEKQGVSTWVWVGGVVIAVVIALLLLN
jgi:carbon monoxide dehydrogenase subunit G